MKERNQKKNKNFTEETPKRIFSPNKFLDRSTKTKLLFPYIVLLTILSLSWPFLLILPPAPPPTSGTALWSRITKNNLRNRNVPTETVILSGD